MAPEAAAYEPTKQLVHLALAGSRFVSVCQVIYIATGLVRAGVGKAGVQVCVLVRDRGVAALGLDRELVAAPVLASEVPEGQLVHVFWPAEEEYVPTPQFVQEATAAAE